MINQQLDRYPTRLYKTQLVQKARNGVSSAANIKKTCEYQTMRFARIF
jgi:hypothetical protein